MHDIDITGWLPDPPCSHVSELRDYVRHRDSANTYGKSSQNHEQEQQRRGQWNGCTQVLLKATINVLVHILAGQGGLQWGRSPNMSSLLGAASASGGPVGRSQQLNMLSKLNRSSQDYAEFSRHCQIRCIKVVLSHFAPFEVLHSCVSRCYV